MSNELALYDNMRRAIAAAFKVDEVKDIHDKARDRDVLAPGKEPQERTAREKYPSSCRRDLPGTRRYTRWRLRGPIEDDRGPQMRAKAASRRVTLPLKFHPAAELFPLMAEEELIEQANDIRENGLQEPIVLLDGLILDGRNRWLACEQIGIDDVDVKFAAYGDQKAYGSRGRSWPRTVDICFPPATDEGLEEYVDADFRGPLDDPVSYVVSLNLKRRHLNESQRAMVAAKIATMRQGERTDLASIDAKSQSEAADLLNVGRASVQRARTVLDHGAANVAAAVERGEVSVSTAAKAVKAAPIDAQDSWSADDIKRVATIDKIDKAPPTTVPVTLISGDTDRPEPAQPLALDESGGGGPLPMQFADLEIAPAVEIDHVALAHAALAKLPSEERIQVLTKEAAALGYRLERVH
jgi:hypothetical protein